MLIDGTVTLNDKDKETIADNGNGKKGILDDFMQYNGEPLNFNGAGMRMADNPISSDNNNINNMDLFGGNGLEFLNASELCGNLELLGFGGSINPLSIDNYAYEHCNKRPTAAFQTASSKIIISWKKMASEDENGKEAVWYQLKAINHRHPEVGREASTKMVDLPLQICMKH